METKTLQDSGRGVTTQSVESVKSLLAFMGRDRDPMPEFVEIRIEDNDRVVLVISKKKDAYYVTAEKSCSCPTATFRQGPCKHQNRFFGEKADVKLPANYQRMVRAATEEMESGPSMGAGFKPVMPEPLSEIDRIT